MNPFKTIATQLGQFIVDIRAKFNPLLAALPPLEQLDAGDPVRQVIRSAVWAKEDADRLGESFDGKIKGLEDMLAKFEQDSKDAGVNAALASGDVIKKEDHINLLAQAKTDGKTEAQTEFAEVQRKEKVVTERRGILAGKVGEIAAAAATDEQLLADNWETLEVAVSGRVERLTKIGITAEAKPAAFKALASIPLTPEGATEFDVRFPAYAELAATSPAPAPTPKKGEEKVPVLATGNPDPGSKKRNLI